MISKLISKWPVPHSVWIQWFEQWITLLAAGLPLVDALELSVAMQNGLHTRKTMNRALQSAILELRAGVDLCAAFSGKAIQVPPEISLALSCAQNTGDFAGQLRMHCDRWQRWLAARKALLNSLCYPVFVLFSALLCSWFLQHQPLLQSTGDANSATLLDQVSTGLTLAGLAGIFCLLPRWFRTRSGKPDKSLKMIGPWLPTHAMVSAQYLFLIASELEAGLDLVHCLRPRSTLRTAWLPGAGAQWRGLNQFTTRLARCIQRGQGLYQSCLEAGAPTLLCQQIDVAQHTGQLAQAFHLTAKVCEAQALAQLKKMQAVTGPLLLALAGVTLALAYQNSIAPLYLQLGQPG